jgi:hypothetical protein
MEREKLAGGDESSPTAARRQLHLQPKAHARLLRYFRDVDMMYGGELGNPPYAKRDRSFLAGSASVIGDVGFEGVQIMGPWGRAKGYGGNRGPRGTLWWGRTDAVARAPHPTRDEDGHNRCYIPHVRTPVAPVSPHSAQARSTTQTRKALASTASMIYSRHHDAKQDSIRRVVCEHPCYSKHLMLQCRIHAPSAPPPSSTPLLIAAASAPPRGKSGTPFKVSRRTPWWLRRRLQLGNRAHTKKSVARSPTLSDAPRFLVVKLGSGRDRCDLNMTRWGLARSSISQSYCTTP